MYMYVYVYTHTHKHTHIRSTLILPSLLWHYAIS